MGEIIEFYTPKSVYKECVNLLDAMEHEIQRCKDHVHEVEDEYTRGLQITIDIASEYYETNSKVQFLSDKYSAALELLTDYGTRLEEFKFDGNNFEKFRDLALQFDFVHESLEILHRSLVSAVDELNGVPENMRRAEEQRKIEETLEFIGHYIEDVDKYYSAINTCINNVQNTYVSHVSLNEWCNYIKYIISRDYSILEIFDSLCSDDERLKWYNILEDSENLICYYVNKVIEYISKTYNVTMYKFGFTKALTQGFKTYIQECHDMADGRLKRSEIQ